MGDTGILFSVSSSFAAKIHHFFFGFPVETSSILTITTVPWVCARLFAGMRRWLRGESRAGTATNDLLFPSGKAERRSAWRWRGGGVSLTAGEQGQMAVAVQGERNGQDVPPAWQKGRLAVSTLGLCQANQRVAEPPPGGAQGARQELQIHLWSQGGMAELSCVGPTVLLDADIQRPQNSALHLPSAVCQAKFQEMVHGQLHG